MATSCLCPSRVSCFARGMACDSAIAELCMNGIMVKFAPPSMISAGTDMPAALFMGAERSSPYTAASYSSVGATASNIGHTGAWRIPLICSSGLPTSFMNSTTASPGRFWFNAASRFFLYSLYCLRAASSEL